VLVKKTKAIVKANDGTPYVRRGAQNLPVNTPEKLTLLERNKGITSYENEPVQAALSNVIESQTTQRFIAVVVPTQEPEVWLRKQELIKEGKPTVAGVVLFSDLPQAVLPKRTGIKVSRYKTADEEGTRDALVGDPMTIEGSAYDQINAAVATTREVIEGVRTLGVGGMEMVQYPTETLHEIITNAVLHRDYSIADDVHIRIFDNRVEVQSPGRLPAHITPQNILTERFARNGNLVRVINKFPDPPNKDIGEGLNTAFEAMKKLRLQPPEVSQPENSVLVTIKHVRLASAADIVMQYLDNNEQITNREARQITGIRSENSMKNVFNRLRGKGLIEQVPGTGGFSSAWRKSTKKPRKTK
jgi:ATP-dependent DNA helicase RecG